MSLTRISVAIMVLSLAGSASAQPSIADRPPHFRFYDVDRREAYMARTIGHLSDTPALSRQNGDADLGELDDIRRDQAARKAAHGGHLSTADLSAINARLNRLADRVGIR